MAKSFLDTLFWSDVVLGMGEGNVRNSKFSRLITDLHGNNS